MDLQTLRPSTLLLIKPGSLGDVVHALPVAAAIHARHPETRLAWVVDPRWKPVLEGNPGVAGRIEFPRERFRGLAGALRSLGWLGRLRPLRPEVAIDLQCLLRSALMAKASGARRIVGLSDAREGAGLFYSAAARVEPAQHAVERYLAVLPLLGVPIPDRPAFPLPAGEPVDAPSGAVLLHPYSRGEGKSLTSDQIRGLAERLAPRTVLLAGVGTPPDGLPLNVIDFTNRTTLLQMISLLRHADAVISVDSGPMHLAAALGARLLSIHTWSDPRKVGPYSSSAAIWQGGEIRPQRLGASAALLPEKSITAGDLDAIASWAQSPA